MAKSVVVFDIGMTNKKAAVYDANLRLLESKSKSFAPVLADGLESHDLAGIEDWLLDCLAEFASSHEIGAIGISTHGATMVCVGPDGRVCLPCLYYTHEPGPDFHARFYRMAGRSDDLQRVTGTAGFTALVNPAKGLLFLRERYPEGFASSSLVLNYAQYWGYRLTGIPGADCTCNGVHTYLWDWSSGDYSSVARELGVETKLPGPTRSPWSKLGIVKPEIARRCNLPRDSIVTMGIHDSNASLLPHLLKSGGRDFVLNSTGSWCVMMHPQENYGFSEEEIGKAVFFNRSAFNTPVKTAIFPGGLEFEAWSSLIRGAARAGGDTLADRAGIYRSILGEREDFLLPEIIPGVGQFPGSEGRVESGNGTWYLSDLRKGSRLPECLTDASRAMALLNLSLVSQTRVALYRAGLTNGARVFTEGGFRKNEDYIRLLAAALPDNPVYVTDIAEASLFGCALTTVAALTGATPTYLADRFEVDYRRVEPLGSLEGFESYYSSFLLRTHGDRDPIFKQEGKQP